MDWRPRSSFGFAEAGDEKVFLHISNFVHPARWPENGDSVSFEMGEDERGRPCAREIILHVSGSILRWRHVMELGLLMALPVLALPALTQLLSLWWILFCVVLNSFLSGLLQWLDKRYSIASHSRVSEVTLHLFELLGGWPGSFLGQRLLRHKVSKDEYQAVFWSIVLVHQLFALDLLFGGLLYSGILELSRGNLGIG